jgi:hypothetical protein
LLALLKLQKRLESWTIRHKNGSIHGSFDAGVA